MQDVYKNIEEYDIGKKRKILIVSDDMIADMINNKKLNPVVTELFIRDRTLNISLIFITQSYFNPNKDELFEGSFFWGWGQFDPPLSIPPSYFKKNLSNINMTLYNC